MKKSILLTLALGLAMVGSAQSLKSVQNEAREYYSKAMTRITQLQEEPMSGAKTVVTSSRVMGGVGLTTTTTEYYCDPVPSSEDQIAGTEDLRPYFVRERYESQSAIAKYTREYLYNPDTGRLIFYFEKSGNFWAGESVEVEYRYYFNNKGTFVGGTAKMKSLEDGRDMPADDLQPNKQNAADIYKRATAHAKKLDQLVNHDE